MACLGIALDGELVAGAQVLDVVTSVSNLLQQPVDPLHLLQSESKGTFRSYASAVITKSGNQPLPSPKLYHSTMNSCIPWLGSHTP